MIADSNPGRGWRVLFRAQLLNVYQDEHIKEKDIKDEVTREEAAKEEDIKKEAANGKYIKEAGIKDEVTKEEAAKGEDAAASVLANGQARTKHTTGRKSRDIADVAALANKDIEE